MKIRVVLATLAGVLALGFAYQATANPVHESETTITRMVSVLQDPVEIVKPPVSAEASATVEVRAPEPAADTAQEVQPPQPAAAPESVVAQEPMVTGYQPALMAPAPIADPCCQTCCVMPCCCCPPPPTPTVFCLVDPCGCPHEACVNVPACCGDEQPTISWRNGILGRQFATLCWTCCDHRVEVLITRRGKVRVRD